jgi:hypothetical protein
MSHELTAIFNCSDLARAGTRVKWCVISDSEVKREHKKIVARMIISEVEVDGRGIIAVWNCREIGGSFEKSLVEVAAEVVLGNMGEACERVAEKNWGKFELNQRNFEGKVR